MYTYGMLARRKPKYALKRAPLYPEKLKKKRCKNCPKFFELTKPNREFCSKKCKQEFHRYGNAFGPLKEKLFKMMAAQAKSEAAAQLVAVNARIDEIDERLSSFSANDS